MAAPSLGREIAQGVGKGQWSNLRRGREEKDHPIGGQAPAPQEIADRRPLDAANGEERGIAHAQSCNRAT